MSRLKGVSAVLVLLCLGLFAYGCGGDDGATQEQLDQAREEGAKEAEQQAKLDQLQNQVKQLSKQQMKESQSGQAGNGGSGNQSRGGGSIPTDGPVASCADGVRVGPDTSCSFAMNVAGEKGSNPDSSTIRAYSPVTGEQYTMSCSAWSGGGTVCTGGNGASVYLP